MTPPLNKLPAEALRDGAKRPKASIGQVSYQRSTPLSKRIRNLYPVAENIPARKSKIAESHLVS
jgi:hypothetical protein